MSAKRNDIYNDPYRSAEDGKPGDWVNSRKRTPWRPIFSLVLLGLGMIYAVGLENRIDELASQRGALLQVEGRISEVVSRLDALEGKLQAHDVSGEQPSDS